MEPMPDAEVAEPDDVTVMGVSIPVPPPFAEDLQQRRASFGDPLAHAIPTHVTLLGPTPVPAGDHPELVEHLDTAAATTDPFTMVLRGTGTFRPVSDVVFVQVARGISECEQLERSIRSGRWSRQLPHPYHPHVTVAHDVDEKSLELAFDDLADYAATFEVPSFHLYEQDQDGTWTAVREFALGDGPSR
jgi:2'-5' RNA ligase